MLERISELILTFLYSVLSFLIPSLGTMMEEWGYVIGDDLGDMLWRWASKSIYQGGINLWNVLTGPAIISAIQDPASVSPEAYEMVCNLNATFTALCGSIMGTMYYYRVMKDTCNTNMKISIEHIVKNMCILVGIAGVVVNAPLIISKIFEIFGLVGSMIMGSVELEMQPDATIMDILENGRPGIPTLLFLGVCAVCFIVTGIGVAITVIERVLKIMAVLPFAGVAFTTMIGGGRVADVGYSYIRAIFGFSLEGVLIILIIVVGNMFISTGFLSSALSGIIFDESSWGFWQIVVCGLSQVLGCGAISGLIKGVDNLTHRAFGL